MELSGGAALYDWWLIEQVKNVSAEKQAHPCQIPVAVMQRALQITPFDGPVIDPFCGAGSTLVAAQMGGRRAIGESSEEYCESRNAGSARDAPFTPASPAVGGHEWPYADGWPTDPSNCVALHAACNASMGRRSLKQFLRDRRRLFRGELFPDT